MGTTFSVQSDERNTNVGDLNTIIEEASEYIKKIDAAIIQLVEGGLKGSAINTMASTYKENRDVISKYLKSFAIKSHNLAAQEKALEDWNSEVNVAASGNKN